MKNYGSRCKYTKFMSCSLVIIAESLYCDVKNSCNEQTNGMHQKICTISDLLQERVYATQIRDLEHIKQHLIEELNKFDQHMYYRWRSKYARLHKNLKNSCGNKKNQIRALEYILLWINKLFVLRKVNENLMQPPAPCWPAQLLSYSGSEPVLPKLYYV